MAFSEGEIKDNFLKGFLKRSSDLSVRVRTKRGYELMRVIQL